MQRVARFLIALILGLPLLAYLGDIALARTTRAWFEHDLALRSRQAVVSAHQSLAESWNDRTHLTGILSDITRDERIMGAAACSPSEQMVAATEAYPREFPCHLVLGRMKQDGRSKDRPWAMTSELPTGPVHLSATVLDDGLGAIILVHDITYLGRREMTTRGIVLVGFFALSLRTQGLELEDKRYSLSVHYRRSTRQVAALEAIRCTIDELPGPLRMIPGTSVINILPPESHDKGDALLALRRKENADTALYVGDDTTDEDVFRIDQPGRLLSIRVGRSPSSAAAYFLRDQHEVDELPRRLIKAREEATR